MWSYSEPSVCERKTNKKAHEGEQQSELILELGVIFLLQSAIEQNWTNTIQTATLHTWLWRFRKDFNHDLSFIKRVQLQQKPNCHLRGCTWPWSPLCVCGGGGETKCLWWDVSSTSTGSKRWWLSMTSHASLASTWINQSWTDANTPPHIHTHTHTPNTLHLGSLRPFWKLLGGCSCRLNVWRSLNSEGWHWLSRCMPA